MEVDVGDDVVVVVGVGVLEVPDDGYDYGYDYDDGSAVPSESHNAVCTDPAPDEFAPAPVLFVAIGSGDSDLLFPSLVAAVAFCCDNSVHSLCSSKSSSFASDVRPNHRPDSSFGEAARFTRGKWRGAGKLKQDLAIKATNFSNH